MADPHRYFSLLSTRSIAAAVVAAAGGRVADHHYRLPHHRRLCSFVSPRDGRAYCSGDQHNLSAQLHSFKSVIGARPGFVYTQLEALSDNQ